MKTLEERFFEKVHINTNTGCWEWTAHRQRGYGTFRVGPNHKLAHRVAYEMTGKNIKAGNCICHTCDNPCCVNPFHLFQGTHAQNMADCKRKKRNKRSRNPGVRNGSAKLNHKDVVLIREFMERFPATLSRKHLNFGSASFLARWFGLANGGRITAIMTGKNWSHVK